MNDTKREHYVPECYLELFTNSNGYLHVWDKERGKAFYARPKDVCNEHLLYETKWQGASEKLGEYVSKNGIEKELGKSESQYSHIIKRVLANVQNNGNYVIHNSDKQVINQFVSLLYIRHPIVMEDIMNFYNGVENEAQEFTKGINLLFHLWNWGSPASLIEHSKKRGMFNFDIMGSPANFIKTFLDELHLELWVSQGKEFITSSFPILAYEDDSNENDVILSISSKVALFYTGRIVEDRKKQRRFVDDDLVLLINKLHANRNNANGRFLLGSNLDEYIEKY